MTIDPKRRRLYVGTGDNYSNPPTDTSDSVLAQTYLDVMQRFAANHPPPIQVLPLRYSIEEKMSNIYRQVHDDGLMPLLRHLNSRSDPEEVVAVMVATLELVRMRGVFADQERAFAEIYLRPGDREIDPKELEKHGADIA